MSETSTIAANLRQQRDKLRAEVDADLSAKCEEIARTREVLHKQIGERRELERLQRELTPRKSKGAKDGGDDE